MFSIRNFNFSIVNFPRLTEYYVCTNKQHLYFSWPILETLFKVSQLLQARAFVSGIIIKKIMWTLKTVLCKTLFSYCLLWNKFKFHTLVAVHSTEINSFMAISLYFIWTLFSTNSFVSLQSLGLQILETVPSVRAQIFT